MPAARRRVPRSLGDGPPPAGPAPRATGGRLRTPRTANPATETERRSTACVRPTVLPRLRLERRVRTRSRRRSPSPARVRSPEAVSSRWARQGTAAGCAAETPASAALRPAHSVGRRATLRRPAHPRTRPAPAEKPDTRTASAVGGLEPDGP